MAQIGGKSTIKSKVLATKLFNVTSRTRIVGLEPVEFSYQYVSLRINFFEVLYPLHHRALYSLLEVNGFVL